MYNHLYNATESIYGERYVIGITGHRYGRLRSKSYLSEETEKWLEQIREYIQQLCKEKEKTEVVVIVGMALGVDMFVGKLVLTMKKDYPNLRLGLAIPFEGQQDNYPSKDRALWKRLYEEADYKKTLAPRYTRKVLQERNEYIVKHSHELLAVWDYAPQGGTYNCIEYAFPRIAKLQNINPNTGQFINLDKVRYSLIKQLRYEEAEVQVM